MRSIGILLLIVGVIMIVVGYNKQFSVCPNPKIEYRYIPRTFYDEQLTGGTVMKQFSGMFEEENPWIVDRNIKPAKENNYENFFKQA